MIGQTLGQYRIIEQIGQGGMATVYKAHQPGLDRYVALKILSPLNARQSGFSERFQREARAIANLHHPNILPVYDFGQDGEYSFITMRYVEDAHTLTEMMSGSLNLSQVVDLIGQVAAALDHAHQRGIIHRDVKPDNVLMDGDWALLSDFGLAKLMESSDKLTGAGVGIGTPAYMSPEQGQGLEVDHRTDIYALGVILFEMLTEHIPHHAETPFSIILNRISQPPPSPRSLNLAISEPLEQIILKALATDPDDRFDSAVTLASALKTIVSGTGESQFSPGSYGSPIAMKPRHNLPLPPTPFVGRATQITAIKELLLRPEVRLITLLGPGGTGKTRLSIQAAQAVLNAFPHGLFFVPLADDTDSNQFVSRVAQQLEVREGGRPLLESVKDYLRDKRLLLVLDNFEQLVSTAPVVADLLATAPELKALVSSRIALNLRGEREFPVPPLDLPQATRELTAEKLAGNESVLLFVERAQAVQPDFALTDDNASSIAEICRRLDGLPLALELAAARIKLLQPQAILARLDDRLKLLTGGARDFPVRQQTLRNTLEWSYDLLNPDEKTLYARLSIFVGGFSLEAAEAICNPEGNLDILDGVTTLVSNSLLRQENSGEDDTRFGMLETIRAYALERMAESGELEGLQQQHAQYFTDMILNQVGLQLYTPKALHGLNWLEREHDNIRATLAWSLKSPQGFELATGLVFALHWFWYRRGYFIEGRMWAEQVLAFPALQTPSPLRALGLQSSGMLALWQGQQDTALAQLQESLAFAQRQEDESMLSTALMGNAVALINMGRDSAAQPLLEEARALFKKQNLAYFHVFTLVHLGNAQLGLGNPEQARALHEEALAEARAIGEDWLVTFALNNLGEVARTQGQYGLARRYYEECKALLNNSGDRGDFARFAHSLGYIAQYEGDYAQAGTQFTESLAMFRQLGNRRGMAECMAGLAGLKARQGQPEWGATMLSAAESVLKITGGAWWPADRVEVERNWEIIRSALDEAELTAAQEKGQTMSLKQALGFASEGL